MSQFKVLIVDDSPFMRKVFSDVIDADNAFKVLATASDGQQAVDLALALKPDIITMDLEMPRMNGLEALQRIMAVQATPVIMLSAVTDNGTRDTIKALQYGAVDFIRKPDGAVKLDINQVGEQLLEKLHIALETMNMKTFRLMPAVEEQSELPVPPSSIAEETVSTPVREKESIPEIKPSVSGPKVNREEKLRQPDADLTPKKSDPIGGNAKPVEPTVPRVPTKPELKTQSGSEPDLRKPVRPIETGREDIGQLKAKLTERQIAQAKIPEIKLPDSLASGHASSKNRLEPITNPPLEEKAAMPKKMPKALSDADKPKAPLIAPPALPKPSTSFSHLVAIGTSTGGPRALHEVLTGIPADFPAPILVVQHMPPKFTHSLAQRLDQFCGIHVREASDGETVETATAYIAPGGRHMSLAKDPTGKYRIRLSDEGPRSGHMPSVDFMFESLIGHTQLKRHIVLMTGMGSDGAKGMKALQSDGALTTIAEAEQTCVVYGMPRSAVELGAVSHLLPLQGIAQVLVQEVKSRKT